MINGSLIQDQIRQMGKLIAQLDQFPEGPQKSACKQLVQLLMDVHGTGLERVMELVFESGEAGPAIIDKLARDSAVSSLLLLYSLHPDDLETRVRKGIEHVQPRLRKLACCAQVVQINDEAVHVQITRPAHLCGSSAKEVRTIIEEGVYEFAPDVTELRILGLEVPSSTGFVALETLAGGSLPGGSLATAGREGSPLQAAGMD